MTQFSTISDNLFKLAQADAGVDPGADEYRRGDIAGALLLIEPALQHEQNNVRLKLWWVASHAALGDVPISALCAPLEEIRERVSAVEDLPLAAAVFCVLSLRLQERKQSKVALAMLDSAIDFCRRSGASHADLLRTLAEVQLGLYDDEIERAEKRRESKPYLSSLSEKRQQLEQSLKTTKPKAQVEKPKPGPLTSKSIIVQAIEEEPAKIFVLGDETDAAVVRQAEAVSKEVEPHNWKKSMLALGSLLALTAAGFFYYTADGVQVARIAEDLGPAKETPQPPSATPPVPSDTPVNIPPAKPVATQADQEAAFAELEERLKSLNVESKVSATEKTEEQPGVQPETVPQTQETVSNVNSEIVRYGGEKQADPKSIPNIDPDVQITTETLGSSARQAAIGSLATSKDGRVYGPPATGLPQSVQGLDGTQVQPREVVPFSPPKVYRTITQTKVLSSPSIVSTEVDRLAQGAEVQVVADLGRWLELRSHQGLKGYIYAQDAVPSN